MRYTRAPGARPFRGVVHHLFFALQPDAATRERMANAAQDLKRAHAPHGRWIDPKRYHMTLCFLGRHEALPEGLVSKALAAGDRIDAAPFDFALDAAGSFANRSIPWWLGCHAPSRDLDALAQAIATGLASRDGEPRFVAHVTVLRDADRRLASTGIEPIPWRAAEFVLIDSVLGGTSRHDVLRRWPLRG